MPRVFRFFTLLVSAPLFLTSCATVYEDTAIKSWNLMKKGQQEDAIKLYEKEVTSDKDKLLKLMDEGILLRTAGKFSESNSKFFEAAKIIDMNGYLSIGEETATVLTNEKQSTYQGEDFEKVLIHLYLGLNFLSLGNDDDALVETRRVNEILYKMISEGKRPYELNLFASYLGGALFEDDSNLNDALVAYKNILKTDPTIATYFPVVGVDMIRMAKLMGMGQEFDEYKQKFGKAASDQALQTVKDHSGAVLLLFESGLSPEKYSSREEHKQRRRDGTLAEAMLPVTYYKKRPSQIHRALLEIQGQRSETATLNSIENTAITHLKDRMGRMIAKALLTAGVKAGIAVGVAKATNSSELGVLTGLALMMMSEADTRSWLLLPGELQAAKIFLPAGKYDAKISYLDQNSRVIESETTSVSIQPKKISFIQRRKFD